MTSRREATAQGAVEFAKPAVGTCPQADCAGVLVHNGNVFCEFWGDTCDYALPHPQDTYTDRMVSWENGGTWECDLGSEWHSHPEKPVPGGVCPSK